MSPPRPDGRMVALILMSLIGMTVFLSIPDLFSGWVRLAAVVVVLLSLGGVVATSAYLHARTSGRDRGSSAGNAVRAAAGMFLPPWRTGHGGPRNQKGSDTRACTETGLCPIRWTVAVGPSHPRDGGESVEVTFAGVGDVPAGGWLRWWCR